MREESPKPMWKYIPNMKASIPEVPPPLIGSIEDLREKSPPPSKIVYDKGPYNDKFREPNMNLYRDFIREDRHRTSLTGF